MSVIPEEGFDPNAVAASIWGKQESAPKGLDVPAVVDDELTKLGYPDNSRLSILGNLGRENNWKPDIIFGGHNDPKNAARNRGLMSWQGDRKTNLENYINQNGGDWKPTEENLRLQTQFLDKELQSKYPNIHKTLTDPNVDIPTASRQLRNYINYVPTAPYNTPDSEYDTKNNRIWAEKAASRGLGTFNADKVANGIWNDSFDPNAEATKLWQPDIPAAPAIKPLARPSEPQQPDIAPASPPPVLPAAIQPPVPVDATKPTFVPVGAGPNAGYNDTVAPDVMQPAVRPPQQQKPVATPQRVPQHGTTSVSLNPEDFTFASGEDQGSKVTDIAKAQQGLNTVETPREIGKPTDDLNRVSQTVHSDKADPREAAIDALVRSGNDITKDEATKYVDSLPSPLNSKDYQPGDGIQITFKNIADIKGHDETIAKIRTEQAQAAPGLVTPADLHVGKSWIKEDADWLNSNAGQAVSAINPLLAFLPKDARDWVGSNLAAGWMGGAARTANAVEGTGELIGKLNPILDAIATPIKGTLSEALKDAATSSGEFEKSAGGDGFWSTVVKTAGGAPADISRLYLLTRVPLGGVGSSIVGMAADQGLQSAGRGESRGAIATETGIGGTIGALFGFAPVLGKAGATLEATLTNNPASRLVEEGLTASTIFGGTKLIDQLSGKTENQANQSGIINTLFHLSGLRKESVVDQVAEARDVDGNVTKAKVTEHGLEPVPDSAKANIQMYFDKDATLRNREFVKSLDARDEITIPPKVPPVTEDEIRKSTAEVTGEPVKDAGAAEGKPIEFTPEQIDRMRSALREFA